MPEALDLLREGLHRQLWDKCCGFIDLNIEEFMSIQRRLLQEQIKQLGECELGTNIMGGTPWTIDEYRESVPMTTYADYAPYLLEQREDVLPEKPVYWQRTSGRSGEYPFKWAPVSERAYREQADLFLGILMLATCNEKGEVRFEENDKILWGLAPAPYPSGFWSRSLLEEHIFQFLPPLDEAEKMEFQARFVRGFELASTEGLDIFFGIASVLAAVGEQFGGQTSFKDAFRMLSRPKSLPRIAKALLKSKIARRPMLPKDMWNLKGIATGGGDAAIFREKIKEMWGRYPLEVYGATEANLIAVQTWDYQGLTFIPHLSFLEFLPENERTEMLRDPDYQPKTKLLDEVSSGETYELVVTNFLGGAFMRYRVGDLIRITDLRNDAIGIEIPQMVFHCRADDTIDLAGFALLTEKVIWHALENSDVPYQDWTARKELTEQKDRSIVHLYVELKPNVTMEEDQVFSAINEELKRTDDDYKALVNMLDYEALKITVLPFGSFARYMAKQQAAGADLAWLKPQHINPTEDVMDSLMVLAKT